MIIRHRSETKMRKSLLALTSSQETNLSRRYLKLLESWIPYGMTLFSHWDKRPDCGHFFGGVFPYGIETSTIVLTFAAAANSPEFDANAAGYSRDELNRTVRKGVRYLCFTHDTGPAECVRPDVSIGQTKYEGTKWGERGKGFFRESQCGVSISALFMAAWLIDPVLSDEDRNMLRLIAQDYLDRFGSMEPKSGTFFDTQMEENAWTGAGLTASALMLPDDPRIEKHLEHAFRWIACATSKPADHHDHRLLPNGKTVSEFIGPCCTILPDNTAENHGFVHPNYMASALTQSSFAAVMLASNGKTLPSHTTNHMYEIFRELLKWSDSMGVPLAIQGMDWPYFPVTPWVLSHASANVRFRDSAAAGMEVLALEAAEKMMKQNHGQMIPPDTKKYCHGQQDPAVFRERQIYRLAFTYLLHRLLGDGVDPADSAELKKRQRGVHYYPHGGTVVHVHEKGRSSYSWRNGMMSLAGPQEGLALVGQRRGSILAQIKVHGRILHGRLIHHRVREMNDKVIACTIELFEDLNSSVSGTISKEAFLRREVLFASLPDGQTLIYERVLALEDLSVDEFQQGMVSIINDPIIPETRESCKPQEGRSVRTLFHKEGSNKFEGYACRDNSADSSLHISSRVKTEGRRKNWVNIDNRLGIVFKGDGDCLYTNRHFYKIWRAIEDDLELNFHKTPFTCKAGDTVGELVSLWCPDQQHIDTGKTDINVVRGSSGLQISTGNWLCLWNSDGEPLCVKTVVV